MKKQYFNPSSEAVEIRILQSICETSSEIKNGDSPTGDSGRMAPRHTL